MEEQHFKFYGSELKFMVKKKLHFINIGNRTPCFLKNPMNLGNIGPWVQETGVTSILITPLCHICVITIAVTERNPS